MRCAAAQALLLLLFAPLALGAQRLEPDTAPRPVPDSTAPPAPPRPYIFLRPDVDYGSAALRTPLDVWMNRGLSILMFEHQERALGKIRWGSGLASVRDALTHPRRAIQRAGGTEQWLRQEWLPDGGMWEWACASNYAGHVLAGGITFRFLAEWFQEHHVPAPWLAAGTVYMATMVTNEAVEAQKGPPGDASTISDLLIFDPLGMALFAFDRPARFVADKLQAADWSPQASVTLPGLRLMNLSQVMAYTVPLPGTRRVGALLLFGQAASGGLRVRLGGDYSAGAAMGFEAFTRRVNAATGRESIVPEWGGGLYLDRDNSLLFSVLHSRRTYSGLQMNLFPGVLPGPLRPTGVWAQRSRQGAWSGGVAFRRTLGIGFGAELGH